MTHETIGTGSGNLLNTARPALAATCALLTLSAACAEDSGTMSRPGYAYDDDAPMGTAGAPADAPLQGDMAFAGAAGMYDAPAPDEMQAAGDDPTALAPSPIAAGSRRTLEQFVCPGGAINPGPNALMVNGQQRTFIADFPQNRNARMGILFSFHGYNQAEGEHRRASRLDPDENPALPLVVITPDDLDFELPVGLDWQLDEGSVDKNVDLQMFEAIVACLLQQYDIDRSHIHSLGFSAGSVMTALIHSAYPHIVRSVICISGMWFNDQAQIDNIILAGAVLSPTWPQLDPTDRGTVLLTHGGIGDIAAGIINLEAMAQSAFPFLADGQRAVIDCSHNNGHTGSPDVTPDIISKFIAETPAHMQAPYIESSYGAYPGSCQLRLP